MVEVLPNPYIYLYMVYADIYQKKNYNGGFLVCNIFTDIRNREKFYFSVIKTEVVILVFYQVDYLVTLHHLLSTNDIHIGYHL